MGHILDQSAVLREPVSQNCAAAASRNSVRIIRKLIYEVNRAEMMMPNSTSRKESVDLLHARAHITVAVTAAPSTAAKGMPMLLSQPRKPPAPPPRVMTVTAAADAPVVKPKISGLASALRVTD